MLMLWSVGGVQNVNNGIGSFQINNKLIGTMNWANNILGRK